MVELELEKLRIVDTFKLAPRPDATVIQKKKRKLAFAAYDAVQLAVYCTRGKENL